MRFIFFQIIIFTFLFLLLFCLMRLTMSLEFLGIELMQDNLKDTIKLFSLGAISDLRLISTTFLPLLVAMTLSILKSFKYSNSRGGGAKPLLK